MFLNSILDILVSMLAGRQIPLGICPTFNLVLGVYPSIQQHPSDDITKAVARTSIETSFAPEHVKCGLLKTLEQW